MICMDGTVYLLDPKKGVLHGDVRCRLSIASLDHAASPGESLLHSRVVLRCSRLSDRQEARNMNVIETCFAESSSKPWPSFLRQSLSSRAACTVDPLVLGTCLPTFAVVGQRTWPDRKPKMQSKMLAVVTACQCSAASGLVWLASTTIGVKRFSEVPAEGRTIRRQMEHGCGS